MSNKIIHIIFCILSFCCVYQSRSQDTTVITDLGAIHIFDKDTVAFFGTVINDGVIGLSDSSYIIMFGRAWKHGQRGEIGRIKETANPIVEFRAPHPHTGIANRQWIDQQHNTRDKIGVSFSSLQINNPSGVGLLSDCLIGQQLILKKGHVFLNQQTLFIGDRNTNAQILGYNEHSFIVTNPKKGNGFLVRRNLMVNQTYAFPIGESDHPSSYHPMTVRPKSNMEDIAVNVFSGTWSEGIGGVPMVDSTIKTTWVLKKGSGLPQVYDLSFQHNLEDEASFFRVNRSNTYIAMFDERRWIRISNQHSITGVPNTITTGNPITTTFVHSIQKQLSSDNELYFTKFTSAKLFSPSLSIPNVFTPNGDGVHDRFEIMGIDAYPDNDFTVTNRWGHEVFKIRGYSSAQQFTGSGLSEGTYFYLLRIRIANQSAPIIYKGYLTIIR